MVRSCGDYELGAAAEEGVRDMLDILKEELWAAMFFSPSQSAASLVCTSAFDAQHIDADHSPPRVCARQAVFSVPLVQNIRQDQLR
jgi:hypothetical protein